MSDLSTYKVYQANKLIESAHTMTFDEKRVLLLAVSVLDSRKPDRKKGVVAISAAEFAGMYDMDVKHCYTKLREGGEKLFERAITNIDIETESDKLRWVQRATYKDGVLQLTFTEDVLPLLTVLSERFTGYLLKNISGLETFYAIRMYELLSQYRTTGERTITVTRLREILDLKDKYPSITDLRRYILDPSLEGITATSDLEVSMEPITKGRKVTGFRFSIAVNDGPKRFKPTQAIADESAVVD